jgi:hypothetical protein
MKEEAEIVHITRVSVKNGEKNGRKWEQVGIQISEHGGRWMSCLVNERNEKQLKALKEGDEIKVYVEEKPYGDKTFYNFRLPSPIDTLFASYEDLKKRIEKLEAGSNPVKTTPEQMPDEPYQVPDDLINW